MKRQPEILGKALYDQHHGITLNIILYGIKGEPIEPTYLTAKQALELAESLVRSARQSLPQ